MAFEVHCSKCSARFTLPKDLYERKVKGKVVTVRCKKCRADISVDGTRVDSKTSAALDLTPTVPLTEPSVLPPVEGLWVVSFADDDDRELTVGQLKKAFEGGEINTETLVWNTSLDEWRSIAEVPELVELLGASALGAGGFLGTGVAVVPGANEVIGDDEIGPFRSVGQGTMSEHGEHEAAAEPDAAKATPADEKASEAPTAEPPKVIEGTPTVPLTTPKPSAPAADKDEGPSSRPDSSSKAPAKPARKLPSAPPKVRPAWLSEPPKKPATEDPDLPEGEEAAPSSGTPDLRSLMTGSIVPPEDAQRDQDEKASEDIFAIGGGGIAAALPTIDLTNIDPSPPSSARSAKRKRDDDEPASSQRGGAKSKRPPGTKTKTKRPPAPSDRNAKPRATPPAAEEEKSGSPLVWIGIAGLAAVAVYWFFLRSPERPPEPTPTPTPESPAMTAPPTPSLTAEPTPTTPDAAGPAEDATAPTTEEPVAKEEKPVAKEEKPTGKEEPPTGKEEKPTGKEEKPTGKEEKPTGKEEKPAPTGGDVSMAAPFDANAARASLTSAAGAASGCRKEGDPSGTATVVVTFAPSGRVTTANISGPPYAGTKTGGCIASAMRSAKVPAFSGDHVTVSKTVVIQ